MLTLIARIHCTILYYLFNHQAFRLWMPPANEREL
jgi:hypothetical protein